MQKEKELVINIIAEAFEENQSVNYVVKQDAKRKKRIRSLIDYSYEICKKYGEVIVNEERTAVALLNFPLGKKNPLFTISQDIRLVVKSIGVKRLSLVLKRESIIKKNHPGQAFCHLWYIGVSKNSQGQGIGTKLLETIIRKYDALGMPIYLETSMPENVPWYEKNGMEVYKEIKDFEFTTYLIKRSLKV